MYKRKIFFFVKKKLKKGNLLSTCWYVHMVSGTCLWIIITHMQIIRILYVFTVNTTVIFKVKARWYDVPDAARTQQRLRFPFHIVYIEPGRFHHRYLRDRRQKHFIRAHIFYRIRTNVILRRVQRSPDLFSREHGQRFAAIVVHMAFVGVRCWHAVRFVGEQGRIDFRFYHIVVRKVFGISRICFGCN